MSTSVLGDLSPTFPSETACQGLARVPLSPLLQTGCAPGGGSFALSGCWWQWGSACTPSGSWREGVFPAASVLLPAGPGSSPRPPPPRADAEAGVSLQLQHWLAI